jgi:hypothetical protein
MMKMFALPVTCFDGRKHPTPGSLCRRGQPRPQWKGLEIYDEVKKK